MSAPKTITSGRELFIVDNSDADWKVRSYLSEWCDLSNAIDIATGYFEIGALLCLKDKWQNVDRIRVLMGDEVSRRTKRAFTEGLRKITDRLDQSLESEKPETTFLKEFPGSSKACTLARFSAVFIARINSMPRPILLTAALLWLALLD